MLEWAMLWMNYSHSSHNQTSPRMRTSKTPPTAFLSQWTDVLHAVKEMDRKLPASFSAWRSAHNNLVHEVVDTANKVECVGQILGSQGDLFGGDGVSLWDGLGLSYKASSTAANVAAAKLLQSWKKFMLVQLKLPVPLIAINSGLKRSSSMWLKGSKRCLLDQLRSWVIWQAWLQQGPNNPP